MSVLSIAEGIRATMANTGSPDSAIVLRSGSDAEMTSILMREDIEAITDAPEIARASDVGALASAELFVTVDLVKASTGTTGNAPLRGVDLAAFKVRNLKIVKGRAFEPGRNEVIVGSAAASQYNGLNVGATLKLGQNTWQIVGHLRRGRHGARLGALVRRRRPGAAVPPRHQPAGGLRPAHVAGGVHARSRTG